MNTSATSYNVDLEWLLKLRVVIARCGEMDLARWWNSNKQLGSAGSSVLKRGFPRTHHFAQARSVIAIAEHRCTQLFSPADAITLWRLSDVIEEQLISHWDGWIDRAGAWDGFFVSVGRLAISDPVNALNTLALVTPDEVRTSKKLKRAADSCGLQVGKSFSGARHEIALLALGFALGTANDPVVPFIKGATA